MAVTFSSHRSNWCVVLSMFEIMSEEAQNTESKPQAYGTGACIAWFLVCFTTLPHLIVLR